MSSSSTDRWAALDFGPPAPDVEETEPPVLLDYLSDGRVALITLNRPHADNAITTEMGALLTEVVEDDRGAHRRPGRRPDRSRRPRLLRRAATCGSARP